MIVNGFPAASPREISSLSARDNRSGERAFAGLGRMPPESLSQ